MSWQAMFPQIVPGWPDEEFGITQFEYDQYVEDCAEDDIPAKSFEAWVEEKRGALGEQPGYNEFSWSRCDLCGSHLWGARYPLTALPEDPRSNPDYVALSVCQDCYEQEVM